MHIYVSQSFGIKTVILSSKTLHNLLHSRPCWNIRFDVGIYFIPCKDCKLKYIDETVRNFHKHMNIRDIRLSNLNNALFLHISKTDHNFDFNAATMFVHIHNRRLRQIFKATANFTFNTRPEFFNLSPFLGKLVSNSYNIFKI